jgi:hypothetical protein
MVVVAIMIGAVIVTAATLAVLIPVTVVTAVIVAVGIIVAAVAAGDHDLVDGVRRAIESRGGRLHIDPIIADSGGGGRVAGGGGRYGNAEGQSNRTYAHGGLSFG